MQCELAMVLTNVIAIAYNLDDTLHISENVIDEGLKRIETSFVKLSLWYSKALEYFPSPAGLDDSHESITLYTNLMYIFYQ